MDFVYYKVTLAGLPKSVLRKKGAKDALHLRLPSLSGQVEIKFLANDVIRTNDCTTIAALDLYRIPKIHIKHNNKDKEPGNSGDHSNAVFSRVYYDHKDYKDVAVFKRIKETSKYQHEIKVI